MIEQSKQILSEVLDHTGFIDRRMKKEYRNPQVIRILNYHRTPSEELQNFRKHLEWYQGRFQVIDEASLRKFLQGTLNLTKPGLLISFDVEL